VRPTETCQEDAPCLITQVTTTAGLIVDSAATPAIHDALDRRGLLPEMHTVDTGYLDAALLVTSRKRFGIACRRPVSH
jgi:transposase